MNHQFIFSCLMFFAIPICGSAQVAQNMSLLYNYDDNSLPSSGVISYNDVWAYVGPNGEEIAIVGTLDSILFFDVTDPSNVVKLPSVAPGNSSIWRDFKIYDHYCFGMADQGSEGLTIVDMDSILAGVAHYKTDNSDFVQAHNLWVDTAMAKLYVAGADVPSARRGLIIYDLSSDPWNPTKVGEFNFNQQGFTCGTSNNTYVHDLHVRNDTAYLNKIYSCGFFLADVSNPSSPQYIGDLPPSAFGNGFNHSTWINEDRTIAVVAEETESRPIYIVDISDPTDMVVLSTFKDPLIAGDPDNIAHNPFILDDLVFISYYEDGVVVVDISDPTDPVRVAYYDTHPANTSYSGFRGCWGVYPYLPSGRILATDVSNGFFVLDVDYAALPVDWLSFELTDYDKHSFAIKSTFFHTGALASSHIEWSMDGQHFRPLSSAPFREMGSRQAIIEGRFERPSPLDFFIRLKVEEEDGLVNTSQVHRVPSISEESVPMIFPNPAQGHTWIQLPESAAVQLLDAQNRVIRSNRYAAGRHQIDIADLSAGLYFIRTIQNERKSHTQTLMISSMD